MVWAVRQTILPTPMMFDIALPGLGMAINLPVYQNPAAPSSTIFYLSPTGDVTWG